MRLNLKRLRSQLSSGLDGIESRGDRPTLQAVAAKAGVSITTVSLVLAGKASSRGISEKTDLRVRQAADDLGFAPNLLMRSLRKGRTHILSFYSAYRNRDQRDLYMEKLAFGVETAGGLVGYDVLVHCNFSRSVKETYEFLNGGFADGILLFAPRADDPLLAMLRRSQLPIVIMNGRDAVAPYSSVADDLEQGMQIVADKIVEYGHKNVAILTSNSPSSRDADLRARLLRTKLAAYGIPVPDEKVLPAGDDICADVCRKLRSMPDPPTLVFCWHDRLAYLFLSACEEQGVRVPEDLSVIGYDGLAWPSRTSHVVSSVRVDLDSLALAAVRLLDEAVLDPSSVDTHLIQPVSFLQGTSLGRISLQRSNQ